MTKTLASLALGVTATVGIASAAEITYGIADTPAVPAGAHGLWLPDFLKGIDGGEDNYWTLLAGSTFTQNGTSATVSAVVENNKASDLGLDLRLDVEFNLILMEDADKRFCSSGSCSTTVADDEELVLYTWDTSTLTGLGDLAGLSANVTDYTGGAHRFQFGDGGDAFTALLGGSGWLDWEVTSLPTDGIGYEILTTSLGSGKHGDFNFITTTKTITEVPVPGAFILFGSAVAGLAARRRAKA